MYNHATMLGRMTADPELKQTPQGVAVCRFRIAVDRPTKSGTAREDRKADFINVIAWRQQAEFVAAYFPKGRQLLVDGSLRTDEYTDREGIKRYTVELYADRIVPVGPKPQGVGAQSAQEPDEPIDDLPFGP